MGGLRQIALLTFLLVFLLAFPSTVHGVTHYVSYEGSSTPPFTSWETATYRVSVAAQYCQPPDTILVATGTFFETDSIDMTGGGTILGVDRNLTKLRMQPGLFTLIYSESGNLWIKNLSIESVQGKLGEEAVFFLNTQFKDSLFIDSCSFFALESAVNSFGSYFQATNCLFSECGRIRGPVCWLNWGSGNSRFENNSFFTSQPMLGGQAQYINFDLNWNADSAVVRNNHFHGSQTAIINQDLKGLLSIENNRFTGSVDSVLGVESYVSSYGANVRIINNLFVNENPKNLFGWSVRIFGFYDVHIENNAFLGSMTAVAYDTAQHYQMYPPGHVYIRNNQFFLDTPRPAIVKQKILQFEVDSFYCENSLDSTNLIVAHLSDNLCNAPMFADTIDYRLQAFAPGIDAGNPYILDADGSRSDIGPCGGPHGLTYSYQDLPPQIPQNLQAELVNGKVYLSFEKNTERDFYLHAVYRGESSLIPLDGAHLLGYCYDGFKGSYLDTSKVYFVDSTFVSRSDLYYTVVAYDNSNQPSAAAQSAHLNLTDIEDEAINPMPQTFHLEQNYPNPFNATTAIVYNLPNIGAQPARVKITIFNALGQMVRVLVDQSQFPGRRVALWDGCDNSGIAVSSGVYFYKLQISGVDFINSKKMILLK